MTDINKEWDIERKKARDIDKESGRERMKVREKDGEKRVRGKPLSLPIYLSLSHAFLPYVSCSLSLSLSRSLSFDHLLFL